MMLCGPICSAQSARVVEVLPDGSFVVQIEGQGEFRALGAAKIRELLKQKADLDALTKIDAEKDTQIAKQAQEIALLKKDAEIVGLQRDSFKADFERAQEDAKRNLGLFLGERALRQEASNFIPKGQSHGFAAKMLDFMNSRGFQITVKAILPPVQTFLTARCQR